MSGNPNFPANHIDFHDHENDLTQEEKYTKTLTIIGASAVSLLCYEKEGNAADVLREDNRFKLVREQDIVSAVWSLTDAASVLEQKPNETGYAAPLLAWSTRLQILFLGFPGTQAMGDVLSNINVRQTAAPDLGSRFHAGFLARAVAHTALIEQLARRHKVVVCGHSLG
jgi:hypothetical protein